MSVQVENKEVGTGDTFRYFRFLWLTETKSVLHLAAPYEALLKLKWALFCFFFLVQMTGKRTFTETFQKAESSVFATSLGASARLSSQRTLFTSEAAQTFLSSIEQCTVKNPWNIPPARQSNTCTRLWETTQSLRPWLIVVLISGDTCLVNGILMRKE